MLSSALFQKFLWQTLTRKPRRIVGRWLRNLMSIHSMQLLNCKTTRTTLGVTKGQNIFRWAVIRQQNKQLVIEQLKSGDALPFDILSIKKLTIVTGLGGSAILRRDLALPLTSERTLRRALPFQLEPLLPFPLQDSIVFPQYDQTEKETHITIWATTKEDLKSHLDAWQSLDLDPDQVSTEALALARWARFCFPSQPQLAIVYKNLGIAIDQKRIVCAMHSPDSLRLKLFLKQKYPLFQQIEEGPTRECSHTILPLRLCQSLGVKTIFKGGSINPIQPPLIMSQPRELSHQPEEQTRMTTLPGELWDFAIEIGLALEPFEKNYCQFRTAAVSTRQKKREQSILKTTLVAGIAIILLTIGGGHAIFYIQEQKLRNQIALYHPQASNSLANAIDELRQKVIKEIKTTPPVPSFPTIQEVLAWLSALPSSVDIYHVEYRLVDYPKEKGKNTPYSAQVTIEFQAKSTHDADLLAQHLRQTPSFVESTHELKWTSHLQGYTISFPLQKSF